eukprot:445861-Hanusia_phi.AAC.2
MIGSRKGGNDQDRIEAGQECAVRFHLCMISFLRGAELSMSRTCRGYKIVTEMTTLIKKMTLMLEMMLAFMMAMMVAKLV